tara:strand:- start:147 stop:1079 length:933 start_codon:yes stop_codon:yes gene_type:complete
MKQIGQILVIASFFFVAIEAQAQLNPVRSNYLLTTFMDNPAAAGNKECLDLRVGHRNQWVGFPGSPVNSYLSLSGRLGESVKSVQGVGLRVESDKAGAWGKTTASIAYSHKIRLNNRGWFSGGFSLGMSQYSLDVNGLDITATDPAIKGGTTTQFLFPVIDAGIWYQDKRNVVGISINNATASKLDTLTMDSKTATVFVITGGSSMELDGRFMFRPSANIRYSEGLPTSFEMTGSVVYDDSYSVGIGYRVKSALIGSVQLTLFNYLKVGYSYDFSVSKLNLAARSTNEITIAFSACDMKLTKVQECPAYD